MIVIIIQRKRNNMQNIEFTKLDKDFFKDSTFIIRVGTDDRPATDEDLDDFVKGWKGFIDFMGVDPKPCALISHHGVDISKYTMFELENFKDQIDKRIQTLKIKE